jgi:transposase InsO family protein
MLDRAGLARSMSRASNRYDNAKIVLLWSTLKAETELDVIIPATREEPEEAPLLSRSNLACGL